MRLIVGISAAILLTGCPIEDVDFRSIDGSGNGAVGTDGATDVELIRLTPNYYEDGTDAPSGSDRPSARRISNIVADQSGDIFNKRGVSDMVWQWGQFIDHDIDLTEPKEGAFDIEVPEGDPFFDPGSTGDQVIPLTRSIASFESGTREQVNEITAWIDGSMIYGSDIETATSLRALDGTGKMLTSEGNLLPVGGDGFFQAGDIRSNEQIGLTSMHTLFVREHNYICDMIEDELTEEDNLTGDDIYLLARKAVIAEIQHITYEHWLPIVLGQPFPKYGGYDSSVSPNISTEFSTAAFRFGHTMLATNLLLVDSGGSSSIPLANAFFNPGIIQGSGIAPVLRGLAMQPAQELDAKVVGGVRNFLFGPPGAGGFDLASLNIQRGRDHGIGSLNEVRAALGFQPYKNYNAMAFGKDVSDDLKEAYGKDGIDKVDLWIGGLAEKKTKGSLVGKTFWYIIADQFHRIRAADPFYYENDLPEPFLSYVQETTLADIIRRNTSAGDELPDNVFFAY